MDDIASEAAIACLQLYRESSVREIRGLEPRLRELVRECYEVGREADALIKNEIFHEKE